MKNLAVVGAGGGGLAAALLAQSQGVPTTLYDGHRFPGGSAGWFTRGPFSFDAGATTLSGLGPGRPVTRWSELTGAPVDVWPADPGIVFHLAGETFAYGRSQEEWLATLERVFPGIAHRRFWADVKALETRAWGMLAHLENFPPTRVSDLKSLPQWLRGLPLLPTLATDLSTFRRLRQGSSEKFERWLNALCMISAQNHADQVPALIGTLALTYPQETYLPKGGMQGLFSGWLSHFQALGGEWKPSSLVTGLAPVAAQWSVTTHAEERRFDHVVANLTTWSLEKLITDLRTSPDEAWGAFTLYAAVRTGATPIRESYHLVLPDTDVEDYFVSFSHPEDRARAPEGWQTVTMSQHTLPTDWFSLSPEEYKAKKLARAEGIWRHFLKEFPQVQEVKLQAAGTPKTFARYTSREAGRVGGLPHRWAHPFWMWPSWRRRPGLSQVGDTVFPGQGLVAVITSAMNWWQGSRRDLHL